MKILSIETSCDDTAISIMEVHPPKAGKKGGITNASFKVLANNSNSQINIHIPFGGVFPKLAKQEHIKNLPILLELCLKQAKLDKKKKPIDAIMITYGPGLEMSLWTGIAFAKELAQKWKVPLIPVNHMEGHVLSVFGKEKGTFKIKKVETPILTLLVSGGHTQLVLSKKWMDYEIIGKTLDDAVGEAFDKVARMLDLPYPGGPQISKLAGEARNLCEGSIAQAVEPSIANFQQKIMRAESAQVSRFSLSRDTIKIDSLSFSLPRPMLHTKDFNFSFSGLKTAVLYLIRDLGGIEKIDQNTKKQIALEFENAAIECLTYKTKKALEKYDIKTLIVAGGVAANKYLQDEIKKITKSKIKFMFPPKGLIGDNSIMIGIAGYLNYIKNKKKVPKLDSIKAIGDLRL
ncbi:MAG: tRNA (adenosine(37)-N6)-threonylcarbamoyltransferase complex transferase subunit TsaD [Candidatus Pacebacteria bacterium]|nr:tRNA (adenosine(37)-N6)-threonylcarbamoyltransferase complex transferase subunit TsaD [Candidatus Paceibacterota bacterium]